MPLALNMTDLSERTVSKLGLTSCAKEAGVNKFMNVFDLTNVVDIG